MDPGIHTMSAERYHGDPAARPSLTASIIKTLSVDSPLHAWTRHPRLNPDFERREDSKFDVGTLAHAFLLEDRSDQVVVIEADDWRKKAAQEARDEARADGKIPMLAYQWDKVEAMVIMVRAQIAARSDEPPLFSDGKAEETLIWEEHGVTCRARLDWLRDDHTGIDDLKTAAVTANPVDWSRRILWSIGSDIQSAFYLRGLKKLTGKEAQFRYVVAETSEPYAVSVVSLAPSGLELGNAKIDRALETWKRCLDTGVWPAYPDGTYYAEVPPWAEMAFMERDGEMAA